MCNVALLVAGVSNPAAATFSIVACDEDSGACGVAVATHNLAVGSSVPFAQFGVGAGVSQFETNPCHANAALSALREEGKATAALQSALAKGNHCPDGLGDDFRQVAVVSADGTAATFTGSEAAVHAGDLSADYVSVQGNGLASAAVLETMLATYRASTGTLAERLLEALESGQRVGGQSIGVLSAALLVKTEDGWPVDTDLRIDFAHGTALVELRTLYDATVARQLLFRAARTTPSTDALRLVKRAVALAPDWDRVLLRAASLAQSLGADELASQYACLFQMLNETWASRLADEIDFTECEGAGESQLD